LARGLSGGWPSAAAGPAIWRKLREKENNRVYGDRIRLARLFGRDNGKAFVIAFDHGARQGAIRGSEDAAAAIRRIIGCHPDGVFITKGLLHRFGDLFAVPRGPIAIVRGDTWLIDERAGLPVEDAVGYGAEEQRLIMTPEHAVQLGADAIAVNLIMGTSGRFFIDNKAGIARLADEAHGAGIFLVVEVVDWGPVAKPENRVELLTLGARVAAELGGDVVKVPYLGSVADMSRLVSVCPVPVLALGGPPIEEDVLIATTKDVLASGVAGIVYGRNIWQADNPVERVAHILKVVDATPAVAEPN
jgi:fructose-bisphosphate aldolase, class I